MKLATPPATYSMDYEVRRNAVLEEADRFNMKRNADAETAGRVILTAPDGSRYALSVANDGTLSAVAV